MGKSLVLLICAMLVMVSTTRVVFGDEDQEDKAESWTDWAKDKLHKNFGIDPNEAKDKAGELMGDAKDATSEAAGTLKDATSDASKYASDKVEEAADATSDGFNKAKEYAEGRKTMEYGDHKLNKPYRKGKRVLRSLSESAAEHGKDTVDKSKDAYNEAKETVKSGSEKAKESVEGAYDEAKNKVGKAYEGAKDTASKAAGTIESKTD